MSFDEIMESLQRAWDRALAYLPTVGAAVGAILGFYVIARLLRWFVASALRKRTRIDNASDTTRVGRLLAAVRPGLAPSKAIAQICYLFTLLVGWMIALDVLGVPAIRDTLRAILGYAPNLGSAILIVALGAFVAAAAGRLVSALLREIGSPLAGMLGSLTEIVLLVIVTAVALQPLGVDTTILTANLTLMVGLVAGLIVFLLAWAMRRPAELIIANYYLRRLVAVGDDLEIAAVRGRVVGFSPLGVVVLVDGMEQMVPARHVLDGLRRSPEARDAKP